MTTQLPVEARNAVDGQVTFTDLRAMPGGVFDLKSGSVTATNVYIYPGGDVRVAAGATLHVTGGTYYLADVQSMTASTTALPKEGGAVDVALAGVGFSAGVMVGAFLGSDRSAPLATADATGSDSAMAAQLQLAANPDPTQQVLTLGWSVDGGYSWMFPATPVQVTVEPRIQPTAITLEPHELTLAVGDMARLAATPKPDEANELGMGWTVSDANGLALEPNGLNATVRGLVPGTYTVTATAAAGGATGSCTVTVVPRVAVTGVALVPPALSLAVGATGQLAATVLPENATNKAVTWASSNADIASVDENGLVTAHAAGTAVITATAVDGGFAATCTVTVTAPTGGGSTSPKTGDGGMLPLFAGLFAAAALGLGGVLAGKRRTGGKG